MPEICSFCRLVFGIYASVNRSRWKEKDIIEMTDDTGPLDETGSHWDRWHLTGIFYPNIMILYFTFFISQYQTLLVCSSAADEMDKMEMLTFLVQIPTKCSTAHKMQHEFKVLWVWTNVYLWHGFLIWNPLFNLCLLK